MADHTTQTLADRPCPLTFIMPAGLIGGVIWFCMLLGRMPGW